MQSRKPLAPIVLSLLLFACNGQAPATDPAPQPGATETAAEPTQPERIPDEEISIRYIYDRQYAHQNEYYKILHYDTGYESESGQTFGEGQIMAFKASAARNLIASDRYYICKSNDKRPRIYVEFENRGQKYEISASSRCLNWAPWNIFVGGKPYVQMTGDFGRELYNIMTTLNPEKWQDPKLTAGIIDWNQEGLPLPEGMTPDEGPLKNWTKKIEQHPDFIKTFQDKEGNALPLTSVKMACNQKDIENCTKINGTAEVKLAERMYYPIFFTFNAQELTITNLPAQLPRMLEFASTKLADFARASDDADFLFAMDPEEDCEAVKLAAPTVLPKIKDKDPKKIGCMRYTVSPRPKAPEAEPVAEAPLQAMVPNAPAPAPTLPMPTLLVYPSLRAAWVLYEKDKNSTKLFETITKSQKVAKYTEEKTIIFATEAGKLHILK